MGQLQVEIDMKNHSKFHGLFGRQVNGLFAFMLLGVGCLAHTMNYRTFTKGNIQAGGSLSPNGEAKYYSLTIGNSKTPLTKATHFSIRFSNGKTLRAADFTTEKIASIATLRKLLPANSQYGSGAEEYSLEGVAFVFQGERCISLRANWIQLPTKVYAPEIGAADANRFYQMPLTQGQLTILFGEPDSVQDRISL